MEEDKEVVVSDAPEIKLFGRWTTSDVQINDISLTVRYAYRNTNQIEI